MIKYKQLGGITGILRNLLLIFLVVTFGITAGALILRHSISSKLERLSSKLAGSTQQPLLNGLLVELNMAENSFQKASSGGRSLDLAAYKNQLHSIFNRIDTITSQYRKAHAAFQPGTPDQFALALQQKLEVSQRLFRLHTRFDSLLKLTTLKNIRPKVQPRRYRQEIRTDTVIQTKEESTKAGLVKRLKDALRNRNAVKVMTIRERADRNRVIAEMNDRSLLDSLGRQYRALSRSNQELVLANANLLTELRQLLLQLQQTDREAYEKNREDTLKQYQSATRDLNTYTGIASGLVLLFIVMLIIYIRRASFAERRYKVANSRALTLAGQKSEILAIMSHEIRNKLMAINGAVYMIKKTELSTEQDKKINAISLSSSLLLETVNNVLDMSKLEQQPTTLAIHEFAPAAAIGDSLEAMRFMAENKNIGLEFSPMGPVDQLVLGDSFRLKQVLINLLSNAIKYTDIGKVIVSAEMQDSEGTPVLKVSVKDTGPGIAKSKQAKLFSAYYQAGGQKPGTGLGLYLCRQLIRLQGGEISLESAEGMGCTVTLSIPYNQPPDHTP